MGRSKKARPQSRTRTSSCTRALFLGLLIAALVLPGAPVFAASELQAGKEQRSVSSEKADPQDSNLAEETADKKTAPSDEWSVNLTESKIILRGAVPSQEDRQTALGMVKAHFPDLTVEEKIEIADTGLSQEQWLAAVSFGLQQLANMSKGKVRLSDGSLTVLGMAKNAEDYGKIKKALAGSLPAGLTVKSDSVRAPVADPFVFQADLGPNALSLAGSVPSENARKNVRDLSRQLFARPGLDDRLQVASGAPKEWDEAVAAALRALSRLETGKVALTGVDVSIEGVAPDQGTAVAVSYQLRRDLPDKFSSSESIKWKEASTSLNGQNLEDRPSGVAAMLIPRIKTSPAEETQRWRSGALPPLMPVNGAR